MKIRITNKQMAWVVYASANYILSNRLKLQIGELFTLNSDPNFEQEIDVNAENFKTMMIATSNMIQGEAKDINPEIHLSIKNQILTVAAPVLQHLQTLTDEVEIENYRLENQEILQMAQDVQEILVYNEQQKENKILAGYEIMTNWFNN